MGEKWSTNNCYLPSCPSFGECRYSDFSPIEGLIDTVRRKSHLLPVKVHSSNIPNAGDGLFATKKIAPNTLMGVYCGVVGTHRDSNANSDSLFELGWFRERSNWIPLVVDGQISNDGTRFVNSKHFE